MLIKHYTRDKNGEIIRVNDLTYQHQSYLNETIFLTIKDLEHSVQMSKELMDWFSTNCNEWDEDGNPTDFQYPKEKDYYFELSEKIERETETIKCLNQYINYDEREKRRQELLQKQMDDWFKERGLDK